jgi:hypothetical protein
MSSADRPFRRSSVRGSAFSGSRFCARRRADFRFLTKSAHTIRADSMRAGRTHGRLDDSRPCRRTQSGWCAPSRAIWHLSSSLAHTIRAAIVWRPRHGLACLAPASFAQTRAPALAGPVAGVHFRSVDELVADASRKLRKVEGKAFEKPFRVLYEEQSRKGQRRLSPERANQRLRGSKRYGHRPGGLECNGPGDPGWALANARQRSWSVTYRSSTAMYSVS